MKNFKKKFIEIKEELKELNPNNENIVDSIIAPIFFVIVSNFLNLNQSIYITALLLLVLLIFRALKKQKIKYVFYGFLGSLLALYLARIQGSTSGFFIPGIIRDGAIAIIGFVSVIIGKPFTIYSSKAFRNWPKNWYYHPQVKPAYTRVALIWSFYLLFKALLQVYFFNSPEVLVIIKLATSNQTTIILLIISYMIGQNNLQSLNGPSVEEFLEEKPKPWISQQKGF